jgi:transcription initiation factor TFIID subunit 13
MEPRQRPRTTGQQWFPTEDLEAMLYAFGDTRQPLPETVRVLDSIITDFVIETCHEAEAHARYAGRSKVKVDDFQFCLRHDSKKLGRVQDLLDIDRELKNKRKAFNVDEGSIEKDVVVPAAGATSEALSASKKARKNKAEGSTIGSAS